MSEKRDDDGTANDSTQSDNNKKELETLAKLIEQEREIDEEVIDVLGGSDENCCTYAEGYVKRQAVYACLTCVPESRDDPSKRAGICLACSYQCHDDHDLIELYTKRNFRCDCGTSKILAVRCKLDASKLDDNNRNVYGQNFSGVYCTCQRPYPDPDDHTEDEMIQCVVCEDWFHSRHLNVEVPDFNAFDEMICDSCTLNNEFLNYYSEFCIKPEQPALEQTESNDSEAIASSDEQNVIESTAIEINEITAHQMSDENCNKRIAAEVDVTNIPTNKKFKSDEASTSSSSDVCVRPNTVMDKFKGASFWAVEWRAKLCKCTACMTEYGKTGVEYLLDEDDTVYAYKEKGRAKAVAAAANPSTLHDQDMHDLAGMDHVTKIETIMAYNRIKQKITNYITTLVTNQ